MVAGERAMLNPARVELLERRNDLRAPVTDHLGRRVCDDGGDVVSERVAAHLADQDDALARFLDPRAVYPDDVFVVDRAESFDGLVELLDCVFGNGLD